MGRVWNVALKADFQLNFTMPYGFLFLIEIIVYRNFYIQTLT